MTDEYLYSKWQNIPLPCTPGAALEVFADLKKRHAHKGRHYHNFDHLEAMFRLFDAHCGQLQDPEVVALAIFFHDAVYDAKRKDNEEKSAALAEKRLQELNFPKDRTERVSTFILATKNHLLPENAHPDLAFFLDFDLAILGASREAYEAYTQKIRREYRIYPDLLYRPGRRKALEHFLQRPFIFQTDTFRANFEQRAVENVRREIGLLTA